MSEKKEAAWAAIVLVAVLVFFYYRGNKDDSQTQQDIKDAAFKEGIDTGRSQLCNEIGKAYNQELQWNLKLKGICP